MYVATPDQFLASTSSCRVQAQSSFAFARNITIPLYREMIDVDGGALVADKRTVLVTGSCGLIGIDAIPCKTGNLRHRNRYNLGGGKANSRSILEAFQMSEEVTVK